MRAQNDPGVFREGTGFALALHTSPALRRTPPRRAHAGEDIPEEELRDMIEEADRDGDGQVTFEDFLRLMKRHQDPWADDE